jgi:hypothetical protein
MGIGLSRALPCVIFAVIVVACDKGKDAGGGGPATNKFVEESKNAEGRSSLGVIAKAMQAAFDEERSPSGVLAPGTATEVHHELCGSTSKPVPESLSAVDGKKYQSSASEWNVDETRNAGFSCLRFSLNDPQYFQYEVKSDPARGEFTAYARRPVGNEILELSISGKVQNGVLNLAPAIAEKRTPR